MKVSERRTARWANIDPHNVDYLKVVPMKNALALASAAKLSKSHHIQMSANHYTGIVYLPFILTHIAGEARKGAEDDASVAE